MGKKIKTTANHFGGIVKEFLLDFGDRRKFDAFFAFCINHTISYLRILQSQKYRLPIEKATEENPLLDIAIDVVGPLFQKDKSGQYFIIKDFLVRRNIIDYSKTSNELLFSQISILLRGFIRKQLHLVKRGNSPQVFNLKRRFREILTPPDYMEYMEDNGRTVYVFLSKYEKDLRKVKPLLCDEGITRLVYQAHCESINYTGWCLKIFIGLNEATGYKNYLHKYQLISTAISVKAEFVELYYHQWRPQTPEEYYITSHVNRSIKCALKGIKENSLVRFIEKGRITPEEADLLVAAAQNFLLDRFNGGRVEKLPVYFREQFSDIDQETYLSEFKYMFDTVISEALELFAEYFHD